MPSTLRTSLCVSIATLSLAACTNFAANFRPADQGPRYYTAAHDTVGGDCIKEKTHTASHKADGRFTIEDALPTRNNVVRCLTEVSP